MCVVFRDALGKERGAVRGGQAGHHDVVLDADRNTIQGQRLAFGPAPVGLLGRGQRILPGDGNERADPVVVRVDPIQAFLHHLGRSRRTGTIRRKQSRCDWQAGHERLSSRRIGFCRFSI